jgi:hypothetical protein
MVAYLKIFMYAVSIFLPRELVYTSILFTETAVASYNLNCVSKMVFYRMIC